VRFQPFVYDSENQQVLATIEPMTQQDADETNAQPLWQTSWTSEYLANPKYEKYAAKVGDELIALAAYEILENALVVHIVYMVLNMLCMMFHLLMSHLLYMMKAMMVCMTMMNMLENCYKLQNLY